MICPKVPLTCVAAVMPPELWANQPYTFSSDLWALGCCLYELMTYRWVSLWPRAAAELPMCMMLSRAACAHHPSAQHLASSQISLAEAAVSKRFAPAGFHSRPSPWQSCGARS